MRSPDEMKTLNLNLTPSEVVVASILAHHGWSNVEIASLLGVSHRTVESHIANALFKTQAKNRVQLVLWVQKYLME